MAGRLGVLRRLVGVEGSWAVVQFAGARAESLRSSLSCVRRRAEALGPGEVRGRRTLLSQPRDVGLVGEVLEALETAGCRCDCDCGCDCWLRAEGLSAPPSPGALTAASSLMAGLRRNLPS